MQRRYTEIAQRIFKHSDIQYSLTPDETLNSLMYRTLFYVNIYGSYKLLKTVRFFLAHPVYIKILKSSHMLDGNSWFMLLSQYPLSDTHLLATPQTCYRQVDICQMGSISRYSRHMANVKTAALTHTSRGLPACAASSVI